MQMKVISQTLMKMTFNNSTYVAGNLSHHLNRSKFDPNNSQSHCWQNYNFLLISSVGYRKKRKTRK